jgi:hypothetical protein
MNPYKALTKDRAKGLEDSNLSRSALCYQLARTLVQKELLTELIRSATIEDYPDQFTGLMNKIKTHEQRQ